LYDFGVDDAVADYLSELDQALAGLPRSRRREVIDQLAARIVVERAGGMSADELVARVGEPADIAAAARARFGLGPDPSSWREVATLFALPAGGLIVPGVGWIAGVVLLWMSDAWSTRDKLIGTLVIPGGLLTPFALLSYLTLGPAGIALLAMLFVAPILSAFYLARRMTQSRPQ
jgi:hypothetical protein